MYIAALILTVLSHRKYVNLRNHLIGFLIQEHNERGTVEV